MRRRDLFKALLAVPLAAVGIKLAPETVLVPPPIIPQPYTIPSAPFTGGNLSFGGVPIITDVNCPPGTIYLMDPSFLSPSHMFVAMSKERDA